METSLTRGDAAPCAAYTPTAADCRRRARPPRNRPAYRRADPLAAALPLFRELLGDGAAADGHVFAVADADGTLLCVEGGTATIERGERTHFAEQAVWSEARAGTNAQVPHWSWGAPSRS